MLQKGKVENVKQEMKKMKVHTLGPSEMRWKGAGGEHHYRGSGGILDLGNGQESNESTIN